METVVAPNEELFRSLKQRKKTQSSLNEDNIKTVVAPDSNTFNSLKSMFQDSKSRDEIRAMNMEKERPEEDRFHPWKFAKDMYQSMVQTRQDISDGIKSDLISKYESAKDTDWKKLGDNIVEEAKKSDTYKQFLKSFGSGSMGMLRGGANLVRWMAETDNEYNRLADWSGDFREYISTMSKDSADFWEDKSRKLSPSELAMASWEQRPLSKALNVVGQGAIPFGAAVVSTMLTQNPAVGASMYGALTLGDTYSESREKGLSVGQSNLYALLDAAWTTATERIAFDKILSTAGKNIFKRIGISSLTESTQELIQTIGSNMIAKYGYDKSRNILDNFIEAIVGGGFLGMFGGAFQPGSDFFGESGKKIVEAGKKLQSNAKSISEKIPGSEWRQVRKAIREDFDSQRNQINQKYMEELEIEKDSGNLGFAEHRMKTRLKVIDTLERETIESARIDYEKSKKRDEMQKYYDSIKPDRPSPVSKKKMNAMKEQVRQEQLESMTDEERAVISEIPTDEKEGSIKKPETKMSSKTKLLTEEGVKDFIENNLKYAGILAGKPELSRKDVQVASKTKRWTSNERKQFHKSLKENMQSHKWKWAPSMESVGKDLVNKTQIVSWAEQNFDIPIRARTTERMRKVEGFFNRKTQLIKLKHWGNLAVMSHEIAHHIDTLTGGKAVKSRGAWRGMSAKNKAGELLPLEFRKKMIEELKNLDYDPKARRTSEGFAEFMRHYFTNTDTYSEIAPVFKKYFFEEFLPKNPKLQKKIKKLKTLYEIWDKQGAVNRVLQQMDFKGEHTKTYGIKPKVMSAVDEFKKKWIDEFSTIRTSIEELKRRSNLDIAPSKDPFQMMTYYKSKAGMFARTFVTDKAVNVYGEPVGKGLVEILKPINQNDLDKFIAYATSKRALILDGRGIESGIEEKDAKYIVDKYKNEQWDTVVDEITEWSNHLLDWLVYAGGLSSAEAKMIRNMNPVYLPFKRVFLDGENVNVVGGGKGVSTSKGVRRIKGDARPIINPLEALVQHATEVISKAQKLHIARLFADLAKTRENIGKFITEVPSPLNATKVDSQQFFDKLNELLKNRDIDEEFHESDPDIDLDKLLMFYSQGNMYMGKSNVISIWQDGKRKFFEVNEDLFRALNGLDMIHRGPVLNVLAPFTRMLRLGATQLNLAFSLIRNPIRDMLSYMVFSKKMFAAPWDPFVGTAKGLKAKEGSLAWRFKKGGGSLSGMMGFDRASTMAIYDESFKSILELLNEKKFLKVVTKPVDAIQDLLSVFELGPRIAELESSYKRYTNQGMNSHDAYIKAFNDAQDVTLNFTRSGTYGKITNEASAFFNASIQGLSKVSRQLFSDPRTSIRTIVRGIGYLTLLQMASWSLNKDKEWWKKMPYSYLFSNLFFEIGDDVVRIPIPYDLGMLFMSCPLAAMEIAYRKGGNKELAKQGFIEYTKTQLPNPFALSAITPLYQIWKNENYLGIPVETQSERSEYVTQRTRIYTTKIAKNTSKAFDKLGMEISPIQIDHLIQSYTGGFFKQFKFDNWLSKSDIPVLGAVIQRMPERPLRQINRFFTEYELLKQKKKSEIATKSELKRLHVMNNVYTELVGDQYKVGLMKAVKHFKEDKDPEKMKEIYGYISDLLTKFYGEE
jgi:hypothetical protein